VGANNFFIYLRFFCFVFAFMGDSERLNKPLSRTAKVLPHNDGEPIKGTLMVQWYDLMGSIQVLTFCLLKGKTIYAVGQHSKEV